MPPAPADPLLGTVLADHFRLDRLIGAGGMGAVYRAHDLMLDRDVAVKVLLPELTHHRDSRSRIQREGRITARIRHPGIPTVHDANIDPESQRFYIIQELLTGRTLAQELSTWWPPPRFAITRILAILDALGAAHERGIVHRDVKPANIFLAEGDLLERVCVVDFGISKELQDVQVQTKLTHGPLGTPHYFAPEVLDDASNVDARVDVWSAGIVLYEMLAGSTPWRSTTFVNLLGEIARGDIPDVSKPCPWPLPDSLLPVLRRALQVDPGKRYGNAREFAAAIRALDLRELMSLTTAHRTDVMPIEEYARRLRETEYHAVNVRVADERRTRTRRGWAVARTVRGDDRRWTRGWNSNREVRAGLNSSSPVDGQSGSSLIRSSISNRDLRSGLASSSASNREP